MFPIRQDGNDVLLLVDRHLPLVGGMRLLDVDDVEINAIAVPLVDLLQAPGLETEGRSGVGAEDQPQGAPTVIGESDASLAVEAA